MDALERYQLLALLSSATSKDPSLVPDVIEAATEGVKAFAADQRDDASKLAFMFMALLSNTPPAAVNFAPFTAKQVIDRIAPWFEGTTGLAELRKRYEVAP